MIKISNISILIIILLSVFVGILSNTTLSIFQTLSELTLLLTYIYLSFFIKFKKYELIIYVFLFISLLLSFPYLGSKSFVLSSKSILSGFLPLLILSKLEYNKLFARRVLNFFIFINVSITIFQIKINFFEENIRKNFEGSGLLQNFHFNGFILGVWAIAILSAINYKQLIAALSINRSHSNTSFIAYLISLFFYYRSYFFIKIKQVNIIFYKLFFLIIFLISSILFFINLDLIKYNLFLFGQYVREGSMYVILDQLTNLNLIKSTVSLLPGDVEALLKVDVFSEYISKSIVNEISLYFYIKTLGILNFFSFCFLIYKNCRKLIPFFLLTSLHYSYLLSPLTYIIFFIFVEEEVKNYSLKKIN